MISPCNWGYIQHGAGFVRLFVCLFDSAVDSINKTFSLHWFSYTGLTQEGFVMKLLRNTDTDTLSCVLHRVFRRILAQA